MTIKTRNIRMRTPQTHNPKNARTITQKTTARNTVKSTVRANKTGIAKRIRVDAMEAGVKTKNAFTKTYAKKTETKKNYTAKPRTVKTRTSKAYANDIRQPTMQNKFNSQDVNVKDVNVPADVNSKAYTLNVDENFHQQRIDNFLLRELKSVPKSHVYRLLRKGEVRVNGKRIKAEYKLNVGDVVRIPPVRQAQSTSIKLLPKTQAMLLDRIIYEDDAIIVFNKPSGMASHGGSGLSYGVIEAMRQAKPNLKTLELVHRLDKDTSGCLVLAKKRSALRELHEAWRNDEISKTYTLLVKGKVPARSYTVNVSLEKNRLVSGERFVKVSNNQHAKETLTEFTPIKIFAQTSLLQAKLYTGKTHQIRVHAQYTKNPIAGDTKYGDLEFNKTMEQIGLKRLFLHASELRFKLPGSENVVTFKAPLDDELEKILEKIK